MGKKNHNENYAHKGYFYDLKRELSGVKLPAIVLTCTLAAAIFLPYLGEKISQLSSWYNLKDPLHECIFVNFEHAAQREKIEAIVAQNIKEFSLVSGAERLGTTLLEEISGIASIKCSLDTDHTVRLVITGNNAALLQSHDEPYRKETKAMQVQPHQPAPPTPHTSHPEITVNKDRALTPLEDTFELLLSSTNAIFPKPSQLPHTFHELSE